MTSIGPHVANLTTSDAADVGKSFVWGTRASIVLFVKLRLRVTGGAILIRDAIKESTPRRMRSVNPVSAGIQQELGATSGVSAAFQGVSTGGSRRMNHGEPVSALPTRI